LFSLSHCQSADSVRLVVQIVSHDDRDDLWPIAPRRQAGCRDDSRGDGRRIGYFPGDPQLGRVYPWMGFRLGVIGDLK
jgi:hypothetical protein